MKTVDFLLVVILFIIAIIFVSKGLP